MKYDNNGKLLICMPDMVACGFKENNLYKGISEGYGTLPYIKEGGRLYFDYENLGKTYKEAILKTFGNPYDFMAKKPILNMLPNINEAARQFYLDYRYNGSCELPIEHQLQCLRYIQWLEMLTPFINDLSVKKEIRKALKLSVDEFSKHVMSLMELEKTSGKLNGKHAASWQRLGTNTLILAGKRTSGDGRKGFEAFINSSFGNSNAQVVTDKVVELLNNLFRKQAHKPTPTEVAAQYKAFKQGVMDMVLDETGEVLNPDDYPELSEPTVKLWLGNWENKAPAVAARTGNRQLTINELIPSHKKIAPLYAGSKISIDDRQPPFEYAKGSRVWFYMGIDLASGAWTVWVHGKTKEELLLNFYR